MKILITGATGNIGRYVSPYLAQYHDVLITGTNSKKLKEFLNIEYKILDILDFENLKLCMKNIDCVLHLAGESNPYSKMESLLELNIKGTYNVFEAAFQAGVKKVITASSIHAIEGYPLDEMIRTDDPVRPKNLYGVSKCFIEALASYYGFEKGLKSIAIRIGGYNIFETGGSVQNVWDLSSWLSPRDFNDLILKIVEREDLPPFCLLHAISNNRVKRLSLFKTIEITGYNPQDNAFEIYHKELQ